MQPKQKPKRTLADLISSPGLRLTEDNFKNFLDQLLKCVHPIFEQVFQVNNSRQTIKKKHFLGAHPVSLDKAHLKTLLEGFNDFLVCEKTDGIRYLMFITTYGEVILSGRGDDYYMVNVVLFPQMVNMNAPQQQIAYIFDGELVLDQYPNGKKMITYLFFDCLYYKNQPVFEKSYIDRLKYCQQFAGVRKQCMEEFKKAKSKKSISIEVMQGQPTIRCFCKDFFALDSSVFIMKSMVPKLPHENDGLIFTRNSVPYPVGATQDIIKWKAPEHNTIDFLAVNNMNWVESYGQRIIDLYTIKFNPSTREHDFVFFDFMVVDENKFNEIGEKLNIEQVGDDIRYKNDDDREVCIVECNYIHDYTGDVFNEFLSRYENEGGQFITEMLEVSALATDQIEEEQIVENIHNCFEKKLVNRKGNWSIMKIRSDKNLPNAFGTAKNVYNCIFENITLDDVGNSIQGYLDNFYQQQQMMMQQQKAMNGLRNGGQYPHDKPEMNEDPGVQKRVKPNY